MINKKEVMMNKGNVKVIFSGKRGTKKKVRYAFYERVEKIERRNKIKRSIIIYSLSFFIYLILLILGVILLNFFIEDQSVFYFCCAIYGFLLGAVYGHILIIIADLEEDKK